MNTISNEQINIFQSLFRGREDVFAIRWENTCKSGYVPAYDFNRDEFAKYKAQGGTLKDFPNKQYSRLTQQRIINHLDGKEVIGLSRIGKARSPTPWRGAGVRFYPLCKNCLNTYCNIPPFL